MEGKGRRIPRNVAGRVLAFWATHRPFEVQTKSRDGSQVEEGHSGPETAKTLLVLRTGRREDARILRRWAWRSNVASSCGGPKHRWGRSDWTCPHISHIWAGSPAAAGPSWSPWSIVVPERERKRVSGVRSRQSTYVDQFGVVTLLEIVQHRRLVQVGQVGHIFGFLEFRRVHLGQLVLAKLFRLREHFLFLFSPSFLLSLLRTSRAIFVINLSELNERDGEHGTCALALLERCILSFKFKRNRNILSS